MNPVKLLNLRAAIQGLLVSPEHTLLSAETEEHLRRATNGLQYDYAAVPQEQE